MTTPTTDSPQSLQPTPSHGSSPDRYAVTAVIVVVVVAAVVVGFTLSGHATTGAGRATHPMTSAASTTILASSTAPPTSAVNITPGEIPAAQVNPPSLAGAYTPDPIAVMGAISAYSDWLFAHPNPALLANYMLPTCRYYKGVEAELTTLAGNNGWHARPSVAAIQWIMVNGPFMPGPGFLEGHPAYIGGGVKVVITKTPQSADILNSAGQVVTTFNDQKLLQMAVVTFAQGPDGRFRVIDEAAFNPPGGVAAFES